jgi:3-hydroxyacyl-CoA dehydrogenase
MAEGLEPAAWVTEMLASGSDFLFYKEGSTFSNIPYKITN